LDNSISLRKHHTLDFLSFFIAFGSFQQERLSYDFEDCILPEKHHYSEKFYTNVNLALIRDKNPEIKRGSGEHSQY